MLNIYKKFFLRSGLGCIVIYTFICPLRAFEPYAINYVSDYVVMDSSRSVVVSTGNIVSELLTDATSRLRLESLVKYRDIGQYVIDPTGKKLLVFVGKSDEYYSGILVLRLTDRKFIHYIARKMPWAEKNVIFHDGKIYLEDWSEEHGVLRTFVYSADSFKELTKPLGLKFTGTTCFIPGKEQLYASQGAYDMQTKHAEYLPGLKDIWNYVDLDCRNGKVLMANSKGKTPYKDGELKLFVYDLVKNKFTGEFVPEKAGWVPWYGREWMLTPDGKYAVWTEAADSDGKVVRNGKIVFYNPETGIKYWEIQLPVCTKEELLRGNGYTFVNFSADGKKLVYMLDNSFFVVDYGAKAITNTVNLTDYSHGANFRYVVWP